MTFSATRYGAFTAVAVTAILSTLGACADLERGPAAPVDEVPDGGADDATDGGALSFATPVHGLLLTACQPCHAAGAQAGDTALLLTGDVAADDAVVAPFVDAAAPASSRLLAKMSGQGHGGGIVYASDSVAYQTILKWIQQGARP
jgi:hypothetical protein